MVDKVLWYRKLRHTHRLQACFFFVTYVREAVSRRTLRGTSWREWHDAVRLCRRALSHAPFSRGLSEIFGLPKTPAGAAK